jgi:hypothetical protein
VLGLCPPVVRLPTRNLLLQMYLLVFMPLIQRSGGIESAGGREYEDEKAERSDSHGIYTSGLTGLAGAGCRSPRPRGVWEQASIRT